MSSVKLYSPPIITAKGKVRIGHGANLVWCDVLGRTLRKEGVRVEYHFPAWNNQGKMFDGLSGDDRAEEKLHDLENKFRQKVDLFGLDRYVAYSDSDELSRNNAREQFMELMKRGFIVVDQGSYRLRIDEVKERTGLLDHIKHANFFPHGSRERMMDLVKTLDGSFPISKPREFATKVPGEESSSHRINPIFDLAVSPLLLSPNPVDYSIDGIKTMLHGTFIPFVIWAGLRDVPFSKNVCTHGYLSAKEGVTEESPEDLSRRTNPDVLRYSALPCTHSSEDISLDEGRIKKGLKTTSKIIRLAWHFKNYGFKEHLLGRPDKELTDEIYRMHHLLTADKITDRVLSLSQKLESCSLRETDCSEYSALLESAQPFFPNTYTRAVKILKGEREDV